jgi:hypothetical protein
VNERRHRILLLAAQMQRLAARHEHLHVRTSADQFGDVGGRIE